MWEGCAREREWVKAAEVQDTSVWAPVVPVGKFTQLSGNAVRGFIEGDGPRKHCGAFVGGRVRRGFPGGSVVRICLSMQERASLIPGSGGSPGEGNGNPLQHSCLGNPMDRGAWRSTVCERVRHDLATRQQ